MTYVYASILLVFNTLCLVLVAIGLPGNWLMVAAAALVAWLTWQRGAPWGEQMFHPAVLVVGLGLAMLGELLEFLAGAGGSRVAGGSKAGMWGALIGGIVGGIIATFAIPVPILGSILGACLGAFAGALVFELGGGQKLGFSIRSGGGAAAGRLLGTLAKLAVGLALWAALTVAAFWP